MKNAVQIEHRASSSRSKHEGESSYALCDRLSRTRDNSQRQPPTDQDYAVSTREYQTDQSSLKTAPTAARSVLEKRQQQTHRSRRVDTVTPYQALALIECIGDKASIDQIGPLPSGFSRCPDADNRQRLRVPVHVPEVDHLIAPGCTTKRRSTPAVRMPFSVKAGRGGQRSFRRRPDHAP